MQRAQKTMGFKAACLLVSEKQPGYFGTLPKHIPSRVPRVCGMLGIRKAKRLDRCELEEAVYPQKGRFALGVFEGGFFFGSQELFQKSPAEVYDSVKAKVLIDYPNAQALSFQVYSTTNQFGYALFQGADMVRNYCGDGDNHVTTDFGDLQAEEIPHFDRSKIKDGKRVFEDPQVPDWQFDAALSGETLAFAMTQRFLGAPLDACLDIPLEFELFARLK